MRIGHFEALAPVCPRCRIEGRPDSPLTLTRIGAREGDVVIDGTLQCGAPDCLCEFPVIDAVPVIVADPARYLADSQTQILAREDLSAEALGLLGDAIGPGTPFEATRHHLGAYAHDHWGEFDPEEAASPSAFPPGSVARALRAGLAMLGEGVPEGPALDIGCSVGRASMELAAAGGGPVLGVDLNFSMLRLAQRAILRGRVAYQRRRIGLVYDPRDFAVPAPDAARIDFWASDAMALPFGAGAFARISALNVLDCVPSPVALLNAVAVLLRPAGGAVLSTPYDWAPSATEPAFWIGGHSQRGPHQGAAEPLLRALLTEGQHPQSIAGIAIAGEDPAFPWAVRLHARSTMVYALHLLALRKSA
ncbi:methyltransferase domain-containing protein [Roseomonas hellenica]|uniref:Methyltransferase domain-containing protein n=1 Tax=Plastoroseomonas hellenica TaxID=2687306 RepID=A0ABS5F9P8_9PROT|nr:methyltransferase domain-containing protein [Plastoroseomonas hellenica]